MSEPAKKIAKIILIGNGYVGKTSLRRKYMGKKFNGEYMMTIGADFAIKKIMIDDLEFTLQIWDLAGQSQFELIRARYYKNVSGIIVVFDLTDSNSFQDVPKWINEYLSYNENLFVPVILIGNKLDLVDEEKKLIDKTDVVTCTETILELGKRKDVKIKVEYIETSALLGENVEAAFDLMVSELNYL